MNRPMEISDEQLKQFCKRHHIQKLSLFGSILREDFSPASDVDVLVEFEAGHVPGFFALAGMETELSGILGRKVDLNTPGFFSGPLRKRVLAQAEVQYAAT